MPIKWDEETTTTPMSIKWDEDEIPKQSISTNIQKKSPISPIEIGQILSGDITQAVVGMAGRGAIEDPRKGLAQFMGLAGATSAITNPIGTTLAMTVPKLLDIPIVKQATDISKEYVEKLPKQFVGFPETFLGAVGAAGEFARKTTPEQYRTGLKTGIGALAFGVGKNFDAKYRQWAINFPQKISQAEHQSTLNIAQETKDLGISAKQELQKDYKIFRAETESTPIDYRKSNQILYELYGRSKKGEKIISEAILPKDFMNEMGNIVKEQPPQANLGLVYKMKDAISKSIKWKISPDKITPDQERLRKAYFEFDKIIDESLINAGRIPEKEHIDALNQVAEQVYDITSSVDKLTKGISKSIPTPKRILGAGAGTEEMEILQRLANLEPKMHDVIGKIKGIQTMRGIKNFLRRAGLITAEGVAVGTALRTLGGVGRK